MYGYGVHMQLSRDVLSIAAQGDIDSMLAAALRLAQARLTDSSAFDPFALVIDLEGRLLSAEVDLAGLGKHPESEQIAEAITIQLRTVASTARASAIIVNTRLSERKTDAVEVRLEHREGVALLVLLPYKRARFGGTIDFGDLMPFPAKQEIFA
jgi:hypothetical protein